MSYEMNLNKMAELIKKNEFFEKGNIVSCYAIILPVDFNISQGKFLFQDFGFLFRSNSEKDRDIITEDLQNMIHSLNTPMTQIIDFDALKTHLEKLASKKINDGEVLSELFFTFMRIIHLNSATMHGFINYNTFSTYENKVTYYWSYIGTKEIQDTQIKKLYNAKIEWLGKNENCKSFGAIFTKAN